MGQTLVIAEKPSAAREIAAALNVTKKANGAIESDEYVVTWAAGHLITLKEPDEYKEEWKKWSFEFLPIIPEKFELKVTDDGKKQFAIIKKYLVSKNVTKIVNACDAGREGELIFDYIYRLSGSKTPAFRLWTSAALTPEALLREFKNLKPIEEFNGLRLSARARAVADWCIGMNSSRAITLAAQKLNPKPLEKNKKGNNVFSVGRVQTPTLQFVVKREIEILKFKSAAFWTINADLIGKDSLKFKGQFEYKRDGTFTHQIFSKSDAENVVKECQGKEANVIKVDSKENSTPPPLLFDLTELQKECNKKFGLNADKTLEVTQGLYERYKAVSYPRTEYRHLTDDNRSQIPKILLALKGHIEQNFIDNVNQNYKKENKRIFNNEKVGDHHALLPTDKFPSGLSEVEEKVYKLILNRFLAVFAPNFDYTSSIIVSQCEKNLFISRGKIIKNLGWKSVEKEIPEEEKTTDESDDQKLPNLSLGDKVKFDKLNLKEDKTKAPPRYTDASILSAMQNPSSKAENSEEKELLKICGLGTPATRAAIIKNLETKGYIIREKKNIKPTDKAFELMAMLQNSKQSFLSNPVLTAQWEENLVKIEKEPKNAARFLESLNALTKEIVSNVKSSIQ